MSLKIFFLQLLGPKRSVDHEKENGSGGGMGKI